MNTEKPGAESADLYVYEDIEVIGPTKIVLQAFTSVKDTDWYGKLVDVHPNGAAYNVCYAGSGLVSARFRHGWWEEPSLVEPGKVYRCEIALNPTGIVFRKAHRRDHPSHIVVWVIWGGE